jgi:hypothetical protein
VLKLELVNTGKSVFVSLVYLEIYECVMFINFTPNAITKYRVSEKNLQILGNFLRSLRARYSIRTIRCLHFDSCVSVNGCKDNLSGLVASWYISKTVKIICVHAVCISNYGDG